jgi:hypothetical protein
MRGRLVLLWRNMRRKLRQISECLRRLNEEDEDPYNYPIF